MERAQSARTQREIQTAMNSMLPNTCVTVVAHSPINGAVDQLRENEMAGIQGAHPAREQEFAEGRWCARAALEELARQHRHVELEVASGSAGIGCHREGQLGVRGAPIWPRGVLGAISHSGPWRIATVAEQVDMRGLGIDIEQHQPFGEEVAATVLSASERAGASEAEQLAKFSAKESLYKVWAPLREPGWGSRMSRSRSIAKDYQGNCASIGRGRAVQWNFEWTRKKRRKSPRHAVLPKLRRYVAASSSRKNTC